MLKKLKQLISSPEFKELVKYGIFGCITTAINLGIFFVLEKLGVYYLLANAIGYFIAVTVNYVFNYRFVFTDASSEEKRRWNWKEFFEFFAVRLGSLGLDTVLFFIVTDIMHVNVYVGRITLSVVIILATFIVNKLFVFKKRGE